MNRQSAKNRAAAILCAAGSGLLLFFALESAIARRVGADLFVPVSGGVFLPGRLSRLAVCLVLGFALGLTSRGQGLLAWMDRACDRDRGRWAVSAAVTGLFFLWALRVIVLSYMTNDDPFFLQAIANVPAQGLDAVRNTLAHSAQENTSSISVLLCWLIGQLYRLDPEGYWYLGYHLFILFLSLTVLGRCVLVKTQARRWPVRTGCLIQGLICAGVYMCALAQLSFTVTAAAAGTAAAALVLCRHHETRRGGRLLCDGLSAVLLVLCFLQRRATGYCLVCFWALAVACQALRACLAGREGLRGRLVPLAVTAAVTLAMVGGVFAAAGLECDDDYRDSEYYRSLTLDYLNDQISYEQYERAGVCQELAVLVHGWFFMDERVTTDMFRRVTDTYYADLAAQPAPSLPSRVWTAAGRLADSVASDRQMLCRAGLLLALLGCCAAAFIRFGRRAGPDGLCALCAAGGAAVLMLYQAREGRFLLRVFLVVALPAIAMLLLCALSVPDQALPAAGARRRAAAWLGAVCAAAGAFCCAAGVYVTPHAADAAGRADLFSDQWALEDYARSHPDTTLITSMYDDYFDPLHAPSDYPANRVVWGACGDLAKAPSERLYADAFFRDDVLFMTDNPATAIYLLQYLSLDWGPVQARVVDRVGAGVCMYQLEQIAPGPDYTGWYEQNGMTYYFRDGEALAGAQTVDGEGYTFAPAGAQARFSAVQGGELVYTTDAYSLTDGA